MRESPILDFFSSRFSHISLQILGDKLETRIEDVLEAPELLVEG